VQASSHKLGVTCIKGEVHEGLLFSISNDISVKVGICLCITYMRMYVYKHVCEGLLFSASNDISMKINACTQVYASYMACVHVHIYTCIYTHIYERSYLSSLALRWFKQTCI
jgi:hypothetical protein